MAANFTSGGGADSGALQTLYLMNPNYVGYSDVVPAAAAAPNMMLFNSPAASFGHHQPPQQHLVGIPLQPPPHSSSAVSAVLSLSSREEAPPPATVQQDEQVLMSSSRYLKAAQELLDEAVSVEEAMPPEVKKKMMKKKEEEDGGGGSKAEMSTAERQELHMKKNKLVNMLDEVEHRYRRYHLEMQAASSPFDAAAGRGSARSYTALALGTISRRFRCLRDAIAAQVRSASLILGEDTDGGGRTVGSRLRFIDHRLRQQRALQQLGMARGGGAWRTQRGLPERSVSVLRAWLFEHFLHPYPKDSDKVMLAKQTGLTRSQVSNWFINARVRLWKPMVEEMCLEETGNKEAAGAGEEEEDGGNNRELSAAAVSIVDADPQQQVQPSFYGEDDAAATSFQQQQLNKARTTTRAAHDEPPPPPASFVHVSGAGHRELLMKFMEADGGGEYDGRGQGHHQASAGVEEQGHSMFAAASPYEQFGSGQQFASFAGNSGGGGGGVSLTLGLPRGGGAEQRADSFLMGGSNGGGGAPGYDVDLQSSKALAAQLMRDFMA